MVDPCPSARNMREFAACDKYKYTMEDKRLNEVYTKLMKFTKSYFTVGNRKGEEVAKKLLTAQRQWIKYRDAKCDYIYHTYYPGSQAAISSMSCKYISTKMRADELQKQYEYWSSK